MTGPGSDGKTVGVDVEPFHERVWLLYTMVTRSYSKLAEMTGYSAERCRQIIHAKLAEGADREVLELRKSLYADLEQLKQVYVVAIHNPTNPLTGQPLQPGIMIIPDKDEASMLLKIIHEQAMLVGAPAPKQVSVSQAQPAVNEEAEEYARGVVQFMNLADKIAASGYGSGRSATAVDHELRSEMDVQQETGTPELLLAFEAGALEGEPVPEPVRPARRVQSGRIMPSGLPAADSFKVP